MIDSIKRAIRMSLYVSLALLLSACPGPSTPRAYIAGSWEGTLNLVDEPPKKLFVIFSHTKHDGEFEGTGRLETETAVQRSDLFGLVFRKSVNFNLTLFSPDGREIGYSFGGATDSSTYARTIQGVSAYTKVKKPSVQARSRCVEPAKGSTSAPISHLAFGRLGRC